MWHADVPDILDAVVAVFHLFDFHMLNAVLSSVRNMHSKRKEADL